MAGMGGKVSRHLLGLGVAVIAGLILAAPSGAAVAPCNGHPGLCSRTLDRVVLPGTHNSMGAEELGWSAPNQTFSIPGQLERGARAFLIDTYYGRPVQSNGTTVVQTVDKSEGVETGAPVYLCHYNCTGGASLLEDVFTEIRQFLEENPREVLVFINEDYVGADDFAEVVEASGLIDYTYQRPLDGTWPTLAEMIASRDQVLFLAGDDIGDVPWYHRAYDGPMRETPYTFNAYGEADTALLTSPDLLPDSCRPNRGGNTGGLFLMNHWILGSGVLPIKEFAEVVNTKSALVNRARACEEIRGKLPTILAVDFFGTGDVVGAARELNGLAVDRPRLTPAQIRTKARSLCKRKKGRARTSCIKKQTARLTRLNVRPSL
jgi:hypothetical protein